MRVSVVQRAYLTGLGIGVFCVAYFYLLDRYVFSSHRFSPIFAFLLKNYDQRVAWLALGICVLASVWTGRASVLHLIDFLASHPRGVSLTAAVVTAIASMTLYRGHPVSMDEYAAIFQSKVFASGRLTAQIPPSLVDWLVVRGFNGSFLIASYQTGNVIEAYWPGFALILAPFQLLRAPWLCNSVLTGFALFLIYWITHELTRDKRAAAWAMLFTLASGAFFANGISFYSMQAHLTMNLLFAALLLKPSASRSFFAGLVGSIALVLHNPFPHSMFALPWIAALALIGPRRNLLMLLAGYLPGLAMGLLWILLRNQIGTSGHAEGALAAAAIGAFQWPNWDVVNMRSAAFVKMWIWAMPCLFVFAYLGSRGARADGRLMLFVCSALLTFGGYMFVRFDQGHGWGYRYFHSAWGAIPVLAGCAMSREHPWSRMVPLAGALAILSLMFIVPLQLSQVGNFVARQLAELGDPQRPGNNVYFVHPLGGFYAADMIQFDPLLRDPDLVLVSHGRHQDEQLIRLNWPSAAQVQSNSTFEQWYLDDRDVRTAGKDARQQFGMIEVP